MSDTEKKLATVPIKGNTLAELEKAFRELMLACRCQAGLWDGMGSTLVEDCDGFTPHSFELIEETMSDGGKALKVRFLFVGDV